MSDPSCKCAQAALLVEHFEYRHIASLHARPVWWHVLHICFPNPSTNLPLFTGHLCEKVVYILPFTNFDKICTGRLHCGSMHSCECVAMGSAMASILLAAAWFAPAFFLTARAKSSRSVHVPAVDLPPPKNKYTIDDFIEHCNTLQHTAVLVTLQHTATHCNTLQHTATHCTATCIPCAAIFSTPRVRHVTCMSSIERVTHMSLYVSHT